LDFFRLSTLLHLTLTPFFFSSTKGRAHGKGAIQMVSAWATANRLVLGQRAVESKSNEITAIPKLLKMLEVKG
jgi:predicted transposase YbfD/YdcC